jgi:hypothetical protein
LVFLPYFASLFAQLIQYLGCYLAGVERCAKCAIGWGPSWNSRNKQEDQDLLNENGSVGLAAQVAHIREERRSVWMPTSVNGFPTAWSMAVVGGLTAFQKVTKAVEPIQQLQEVWSIRTATGPLPLIIARLLDGIRFLTTELHQSIG